MRRIYENAVKRVLLSTFIVLLSMASFSATYYVSTAGDDSNSGLTSSLAWKTLARVNAATLSAGDQVLFQRGNTFYGSLTVKNSGTSANTIKLNAYGTGNNPIISGFSTLSSWTSNGNGIYYATLDVPRLNIVTLDGAVKGMGRFPETGYMNYETHNAKVSITDNQLTGTTNWTGAEIGIRKYRWILDRHVVTNHSAGTITYSSNTDYGNATLYEPLDKNGYFIQNNIGCLNDLGDWSYNGSENRIYMYFGSGGPLGHIVKVGSADKNLTISNQSYIDLTNIDFEGANINGLYLTGSNYISINGCNFNNQGGNAIYGLTAKYIKVSGGSIINVLNNGIFFEWDVNNATVDGLTITNAGIIPGASKSGDGTSVGLYIAGNNAVIRNCKITNAGYNGIHFNGDDALVENNRVDSFCTEKDDGAGIYTYGGVRATIRNNIVLNAIGAYAGAEYGYWEPFGKAAGIYLDNGTASHNAIISGNSLAHGEWAGIFINDNGGNSLLNNIVFNFSEQLFIIEYSLGKVRNTTITGNQFIAKTIKQKTLFNQMYVAESPSLLGAFNNNYLARPMDDNLTIQISTNGNTLIQRTLEEWKTYSGQDANSKKSPQAITNENDLQFEYNATQSVKTVSLGRPMIDIKGTKYQGTVTLQPYTSVVLMKDANATIDNTPPVISAFSVPTTSSSLTIPISTFKATDNIGVTGYLLTETASNPLTGTEGWTALVPSDYVFPSAGSKTLYAWVKDAAGNVNYQKNSSVFVEMGILTSNIKSSNEIIKIDIFPNPTTDRLTICFSTQPEVGSRIDILDMAGRKVASRIITGMSEVFNLDHQTPGLYLVKSILGTDENIQKLIITK